MLHLIAVLVGMSIDIGGIGGLLSGLFAKSFKRAVSWSCFWGVINCLVSWQLAQHGNASIITILPFFLAIFWSLIGWFALGRRRSNALKPVSSGSRKGRPCVGNIIGAIFPTIQTMLGKIWKLHNRLLKAVGLHIYFEKYPWLYVVMFFAIGALLPPLAIIYLLSCLASSAERKIIKRVD